MTKADLLKRVSDLCGFTLKDTQLCFNMAMDIIKLETLENGKVTIAGLGSFAVVDRAPRRCSDPRNPDKIIVVPAKRAIRFKASKQFRDMLE